MAKYYTPWVWSAPHKRHYSYLMGDNGVILETLWSGPTEQPGVTESAQAVGAQVLLPGNAAQQWPSPTTPQWPTTAPTSPRYPVASSSGTQPVYRSRDRESDEDEDKDNEDDQDEDGEGGVEGADESKYGHQRSDSKIDDPLLMFSNMKVSSSNTGPSQQATPAGAAYNYAPPSRPGGYTYPSSSGSQPIHPYHPVTPNIPLAVKTLPLDVQSHIGYKARRFIQTEPVQSNVEQLDPRYRRVSKAHHPYFFVPGRVFKMLWAEPAGQINPGRTRNSTHFSFVRFGQTAFSEIRRFVVVRNKGTFSQCIPIQTYNGQGATKANIIMQDHGVIHTTPQAPQLLAGEYLTKYSIQVQPTENEALEPQSRVNYGKAYAVEHNVKVLDIGMVLEGHRYLIQEYFDLAMAS